MGSTRNLHRVFQLWHHVKETSNFIGFEEYMTLDSLSNGFLVVSDTFFMIIGVFRNSIVQFQTLCTIHS